jgi:hypothetical protein
MNRRDLVQAVSFALEVEAQVRCGQARNDALYDFALNEARKTADGFAAALARAEQKPAESTNAG